MKNKDKLKLIKDLRKCIKKDWICCSDIELKDMHVRCMSCIASVVDSFLAEYQDQVKANIKDEKSNNNRKR